MPIICGNATFWNHIETAARVVTVGGLSVVLVAAALAITFIVRGEVRARATASVAVYEARRAITVEYLRLQHAASVSRPDAATGSGPGSPPATPVGLQDHALIALAVAGVRARVIVNGEQEAKLAGYRSAKDDLELHVDPDPTGDGWYPPSALRLVQTTFS